MGSVYSIHSQMKFKDKDKAIKILQAKISRGKEEHTDYGLDTYRKRSSYLQPCGFEIRSLSF